jgi:hypothetical protein
MSVSASLPSEVAIIRMVSEERTTLRTIAAYDVSGGRLTQYSALIYVLQPLASRALRLRW